MSDGRLRVVLAEDHYLVREGTRQLLASHEGVDVVAVVADGLALRAAVAQHAPDVVVTDIRMPPDHQMEGITAALQIRAQRPDTGVVVLSQHANPMYALALFADGTERLAYLLKERLTDLAELVRAITTVADGGSVVDPLVVEALVDRRRNHADHRLPTLSDREREVLREMSRGLSNQAIADGLHLSRSAVEKHITAILAKLDLDPSATDVHRRVSAVLAYLRSTVPG